MAENTNRFLRRLDIVAPEKPQFPIVVIGAGTIGSATVVSVLYGRAQRRDHCGPGDGRSSLLRVGQRGRVNVRPCLQYIGDSLTGRKEDVTIRIGG
jgi:hypothetical protein